MRLGATSELFRAKLAFKVRASGEINTWLLKKNANGALADGWISKGLRWKMKSCQCVGAYLQIITVVDRAAGDAFTSPQQFSTSKLSSYSCVVRV